MRKQLLVSLSLFGLALSGEAFAGECAPGNAPGSCHTLAPSADIVFNDWQIPSLTGSSYVWNGDSVEIAPPSGNGSTVAKPGLSATIGAGGWGQGAAEPMAIAHVKYEYTVAPGVQYLLRPGATGYTFDCMSGTSLCYQQAADLRYIWTSALADIKRAYRVTALGTVPAGVTSVPLKVAYTVGMHINGTVASGAGFVAGVMGRTIVNFGSYTPRAPSGWNYSYDGVTCDSVYSNGQHGLDCKRRSGVAVATQGSAHSEVFDFAAPIAALGNLQLRVIASASRHSPTCRDQTTPDGTQCVVTPYIGYGHVVADPYVFIDPAWPHAARFKLEMSADEADSTWVTPARTAFDTMNLTFTTVDGGTGTDLDGGTADGGSGGEVDGGTADGGSGGEVDGGTGVAPPKATGCQSVGQLGSAWLLVSLVFGVRRHRPRVGFDEGR